MIDIWCIYAVSSPKKCRKLEVWLCKILDKYHVWENKENEIGCFCYKNGFQKKIDFGHI